MKKQSDNKLTWIIVILVAVLAIGATVYALSMSGDSSDRRPSSSESRSDEQSRKEDSLTDVSPPMSNDTVEVGGTVIVFTDDGFKPKTYTSKVGEPVTVRNDSRMDLQFSSDDHPTHSDHSELNMKLLSSGETGTFTPPGPGTYGFHDHINDKFTGTLTVK